MDPMSDAKNHLEKSDSINFIYKKTKYSRNCNAITNGRYWDSVIVIAFW